MAAIKRFEELESWQSARLLVNRIYDLSGLSEFAKDFGLKDQIRRAAVSILSNIAEGFERDSDVDFIRFLWIAKGSAGEVRAQLYVALDRGYIDRNSFLETKQLVEGVSRRIANFIAYLKRSSADAKPTRRSPPAHPPSRDPSCFVCPPLDLFDS